MYNILICDDERDIVSALKIYLSGEDYHIFEAYDGREALEIVRNHEIHLILMDVMMPQLDGIAATAKLREESNVPIIMLTAKSESSDKVLGLNVGADDYITKPFDPAEVVARVRSQLRRYTKLGAAPEPERAGRYSVGPITLDEEAKTVTADGEAVALTPIEYNILRLLIKHPGRIYSSTQIYELVWNESALGAENAVSVHIRHLRQKLEIDPSEPRYLKVVWGLGYKLEDTRHEKG
ncbi:MAG: response regulator transcription factor [Oscillospiraceae bacterium]|nr:response regulator transcription factor [Oscillospiraceae bacterium]